MMIGPDRSVHGGISGVVNNYYEAGLDKRVRLTYIGTMVEGSKLRKLLKAAAAYLCFLLWLPGFGLVHVNMASDASYYRKSVFVRTARLFRKRIVIHQHGGDFEYFFGGLSDKGKERVRRVLAMGDAFVVIAPYLGEFFGRLIGREKITVLPDSIPIPPPVSKKYGCRRILFLGRICREKGIGELLGVMPSLKERFPDVRLYLGGIFEDPELKGQVEALSGCTEWIGWVSGEEKEKYLRECDIFVLPSYFEGQSVAILEAMAYSCTVVASNVGGIPQMIVEGKTGILIEPRNAQDLERGLMEALSDEALCRRLGGSARGKVEAEFSIEENMEQLLLVYKKVFE